MIQFQHAVDCVDKIEKEIAKARASEKFMVGIWRVNWATNDLEFERMTWQFPTDLFEECKKQLEAAIKEEMEATKPEPLPAATLEGISLKVDAERIKAIEEEDNIQGAMEKDKPKEEKLEEFFRSTTLPQYGERIAKELDKTFTKENNDQENQGDVSKTDSVAAGEQEDHQ